MNLEKLKQIGTVFQYVMWLGTESFNVLQIKEIKSCSYNPLFASRSYGFKKSQKRGGKKETKTHKTRADRNYFKSLMQLFKKMLTGSFFIFRAKSLSAFKTLYSITPYTLSIQNDILILFKIKYYTQ